MTQDLRIVGFRGIGFSPNRYHEPKDLFNQQSGLIKAGHVGVSVDGGKTIYGFQPTPEAIAEFPSFKDLLDHLQSGASVEGGVFDDTAIFWQAHRLVSYGARTHVWQLVVPVSPHEFTGIAAKLQAAVAAGSSLGVLYRYPDWGGAPMAEGVDNCATWPRNLGMEILEPTGQMRILMQKLEQHGFPWP